MAPATAKSILDDCETKLRQLLETAAREGDYQAAQRLASLAGQIADLAAATRAGDPTRSPAGGPSSARPARRPAKTSNYPRFLRRGQQLIRVAWSKKEKREYEHKAPKRVVDRLVATLSKHPPAGPLIQTADLLPLHDPADGTEIPLNHVYVTLGWLKQLGLIQQHGRQGYQVPQPANLPRTAKAAWETME